VFTLLATFAVASCGKDTSTSPESLTGLYSLVSYNGQKPPILMPTTGDYKFETLDDHYVLRADGSYTETAIFRTTDSNGARVSTDSVAGKYFANGSTITLTYGSQTYTMALSRNTMTRNDPGRVEIYQK
jgi:hypothetical protein